MWDRLGGTIVIEAQPGQGASFTVSGAGFADTTKTNDTGAPLLPDPVLFAHDLPALGIGQLPTRGLVSVNVYSQSFESEAVCHE